MSKKENPDQLALFTDFFSSVILPERKISTIEFDERARKISNLNRSIREFRLDNNCQLSLTFDENYSKLRMFCSPEEIEQKIQEAIFATPSMLGKIVHVKKYLEEKKIRSRKAKRKRNCSD